MSKKSLGYSALIFLLACFSHPAWSQESTGLKKIRIGMPNRGVPNLGLPAAQRFGFFQAQGLADFQIARSWEEKRHARLDAKET
jgi:hypothetical protein